MPAGIFHHQCFSKINLYYSRRRDFMTKADLIESMADGADISKVAANKALDAMITSITKTLKKNG
jgi:hypothetical protein